MSETILAAEPTIRLAAFLGILVAMALWEVAAPRRRREIPRVIRWTNNLALVVLDTALLRLTFPIIAVGLAVMAEAHAGFVLDALEQAVHDRRPGKGTGLVHHSDRGSPYLSIKSTERLAEAGIEPSVGVRHCA